MAREAVAAGREPARQTYRRLNLQRFVTLAAWDKTARRWKREAAARREMPDDGRDDSPARAGVGCMSASSSLASNALSLAAELLADIRSAKAAGAKMYELVGALRGLMDMARYDLETAAGTRAEELHAARMAELRKRQEEALEGVTTQAALTPEQVAEIRLKVLGL